MRSPAEIPRIAASDIDAETFVRTYVLKSRPVIITGAMEGWLAREWTPESLVARFGAAREMEVAPQQPGRADKWVESCDLWPRGRELCGCADGDAAAASDAGIPGVKRRDIVLAVAAALL